ncbi:MAG: hypothetical protein IJW23_00995 [Lentisphaeria bacterium]|nr:hypothetical protein [Lentisphaeria bacterium]
MRVPGIILLLFLFLLSGCFSRNSYTSGLLDHSELLKMKQERRMRDLKQTRLLRLGIVKNQQKEILEFKKKMESKGWRVQLIPCPEKRLTGLLRSGFLDLICLPGKTEADAEQLDLYFLAPAFLTDNKLLLQEIH